MIGLFGGSFDPIHHGHLIVAQAVLEALDLEEMRFVPAVEQPFKRGRHGAPPEVRARMVSLAIEGQARFRLETAELDRGGPSYTWIRFGRCRLESQGSALPCWSGQMQPGNSTSGGKDR